MLVAVLAVAMLGAVAAPRGPRAKAQVPKKKPNILLILTDDMRADAASMAVMPKTKALFKANGVYYKNAVATTPLCCPSRASIFSGKYGHNHGVHNNNDAPKFDPQDSMQRLLSENGYQTAISGKYLNMQLDDPPFFDQWAIMNGGKKYYDAELNVNGDKKTIHEYVSDFITKKALDFLHNFERSDKKPWFMMLAPYAPHPPATPEPKYDHSRFPIWTGNPATRETHLQDKPEYVRETQAKKPNVKKMRRRMLWSLKSADDMVAQVFKLLQHQNEQRKTLAVFFSDNGYMWYEHGLNSKRTPYDESVRIPMYARWPGHLSAGTIAGKLVANIDIAPTVYEATGITPDYPVDGRSLLSPVQRDNILIEFWHDPQAALVPEWQGIWSPGSTYVEYDTSESEYYDDADKWELNNRLGNDNPNDDPSNEPQLHALLQAYKSCVGPSCP